MNPKEKVDFIVIDDEEMNNYLCRTTIVRIYPESDIQTFTNPAEGFQHLVNTYSKDNSNNAILFLDLKMPGMDGWEVLDKINLLVDEVRQKINVYILSSSLDQADIRRANNHPLVKKYITKPLLINELRKHISNSDFMLE